MMLRVGSHYCRKVISDGTEAVKLICNASDVSGEMCEDTLIQTTGVTTLCMTGVVTFLNEFIPSDPGRDIDSYDEWINQKVTHLVDLSKRVDVPGDPLPVCSIQNECQRHSPPSSLDLPSAADARSAPLLARRRGVSFASELRFDRPEGIEEDTDEREVGSPRFHRSDKEDPETFCDEVLSPMGPSC